MFYRRSKIGKKRYWGCLIAVLPFFRGLSRKRGKNGATGYLIDGGTTKKQFWVTISNAVLTISEVSPNQKKTEYEIFRFVEDRGKDQIAASNQEQYL